MIWYLGTLNESLEDTYDWYKANGLLNSANDFTNIREVFLDKYIHAMEDKHIKWKLYNQYWQLQGSYNFDCTVYYWLLK
jgi:hypothetical protein